LRVQGFEDSRVQGKKNGIQNIGDRIRAKGKGRDGKKS